MPAVRNPNDLNEIDLFRDLTAEEFAWLNDHLNRRTVPAGYYLFTAEEPGEVVYIIRAGTVKIHTEQEDGTDVILAILGTGDTVGEMSLLEGDGRSASVVTLEESTLLWMDRETFQECMRRMPAITYNLVLILAGRLRLANAQIQSLSSLDIYGRVARQVLAFAQQYGQVTDEGDIMIPLRLTQSDLASLVGATREHVNRAMRTYKQQKHLSVDTRYHITIHNQRALAQRCE